MIQRRHSIFLICKELDWQNRECMITLQVVKEDCESNIDPKKTVLPIIEIDNPNFI